LSLRSAAILILSLMAGPAAAAPVTEPAAAPEPELPTIFPLLRIVPKGEARPIAFFASLFPDCSTEGPVVIRLLDQPKHGHATVEEAASFPRYELASPLAGCNTRKVPGKRLVYEADEKFEGADTFRILVINADGTGYESNVKVLVR
jgi:hypothetical protein